MIVCGKEITVRGRLLRIARLAADKHEFLEDPEPVVAQLRDSRSRIDLFTFMQRMPHTTPLYSYPLEWDNLAVLPVSTFEYWWNDQIRSLPRNRARQAEKKGASVREVLFDDTLVKGIWEVYNETPIRQGKPNTHYGKDLETVRREAATLLDRSTFIGLFVRDHLIGFAKLTWDETRTQANLMNIVGMVRERDKAPTNALIAQAVRSCADRRIPYLVYQSFSYGKKEHDGLTNFKEINGFQKIEIPRYYVPLSSIGSLAIRLGLHHKFVDHLPASLVTSLRQIRSAWYRRTLKQATHIS
jgi:hypothetical protein